MTPHVQPESTAADPSALALASRWYLEHIKRAGSGLASACVGWGVLFALGALVGVTQRWPILGSLWIALLVLLAFTIGVINIKGVWRLTVRRTDAYSTHHPMPVHRYLRSRLTLARTIVAAFFFALCWQLALVLLTLPDIRGETTGIALLMTTGPLVLRLVLLALFALQIIVGASITDALLTQASAPRRTNVGHLFALLALVALLPGLLPTLRPMALSICAIAASIAVGLPMARIGREARFILRRIGS